MRTCEICDGPRINGSPVVEYEPGEWRPCNHTVPGSVNACRNCAITLTTGDNEETPTAP